MTAERTASNWAGMSPTALREHAASLRPPERQRFWVATLQQAAIIAPAVNPDLRWDGLVRSLIETESDAVQDVLQGPADRLAEPANAEGDGREACFVAGMLLLRGCEGWIEALPDAERQEPLQHCLGLQLSLVVGRLHHWLVIEEAPGSSRADWFWRGWEVLHWRGQQGEALPDWWEPVREQLARYGALEWLKRIKDCEPASTEGQEAISRALTLLENLGRLHEPVPAWITQAHRYTIQRGLSPWLNEEQLQDEELQRALTWLEPLMPHRIDGRSSEEDETGPTIKRTNLEKLWQALAEAELSELFPEAAGNHSLLPHPTAPEDKPISAAQDSEPALAAATMLSAESGETDGGPERLPEAGAGPPVTLTAIQRRLALLPQVIESLRQQTLRPAKLHLHVSREAHLLDEGIDDQNPILQHLSNDPWVAIHWVPNLGPYRKITPFLTNKGYSDSNGTEDFDQFITVDDDTLYPPRFIEYLVRNHQRYGCIVAHRGRRIRLATNQSDVFLPYSQWHDGMREPRLANLPTGQSGVLYRRSWFPEDLELEAAMALAPTHDDLWLHWLTARQGIKAVILQPNAAAKTNELAFPAAGPEPIREGQTLWHQYNGPAGGNDEAAHAVQAYWQARGFDLAALLKEEQEKEADFY